MHIFSMPLEIEIDEEEREEGEGLEDERDENEGEEHESDEGEGEEGRIKDKEVGGYEACNTEEGEAVEGGIGNGMSDKENSILDGSDIMAPSFSHITSGIL